MPRAKTIFLLSFAALFHSAPCAWGNGPSARIPYPLISKGDVAVPSNDKRLELTPAEQALAAKLHFDEKVLLLIKQTLKPEMGLVKSGGMEPSDSSFIEINQPYKAAPLEKDRLNYENIAKEYPELSKLIKSELEFYSARALDFNAMANEQMVKEYGEAEAKRMAKYSEAMHEFMPVIRQEFADANPGRDTSFIAQFRTKPFGSDDAVDKAVADLKQHYAGKALRPENKASEYLGLRFQGSFQPSFHEDSRIAPLQSQLEALGYRISVETGGIKVSRMFDDRSEAEAFLRESGTAADQLSLSEQPACTYPAIYPVIDNVDLNDPETAKIVARQSMFYSAAPADSSIAEMAKTLAMTANQPKMPMSLNGMFSTLRLSPGSTVKKTGERRWLVTQPARYTATANTMVATVIKSEAGSVGFELIRNSRTNGLNYGITTQKILDKLKYWDKQYGVTVVEAKGDGFKLRFKTLPDDLSTLCTEIFFFCPEMELHEDENDNASAMRQFAKRLKQSSEVSFWWD